MKSGLPRGGIAFTRGSLLHLLGNRVYIGETRHRDAHHPGEHDAIVSQALWDAVQVQRSGNGVTRTAARNIAHTSLLTGLVFDGLGRRMTPSHACKGPRRYRYYVTAPDLVTKDQPSWRLPAHDLETLVTRRMATLLGDAHAVQAAVAEVVELNGSALSAMLDRASRIASTASAGSGDCVPLIERIDLRSDRIDVTVDLARLLEPAADGVTDEPRPIPLIISTPAARIRRGTEVRLVLANPGDHDDGQIDPALVGLIVRAHAARTAVAEHPGRSLADIAAAQGVTTDYFTLLIRLSTLAPDIVTAILAGRQPASLNRQRLARTTNLPLAWDQQRAVLGFIL